VSIDGDLPVIQRKLIERLFTFVPLEGSPVAAWFEAMSHYFSPYDLNPLNLNPLKDMIERSSISRRARLFAIAAVRLHTNVKTGRLHIFSRDKMNADVVMASACLPLLFKASKSTACLLDGGYLANPRFSAVPRHRDRGRPDRPDQPLERNEVPTRRATSSIASTR